MEQNMEKHECKEMEEDNSLDFSADERLVGLWSLIGSKIFYVRQDERGFKVNISRCNMIFSLDRIAYDVMSAVIRKNVNAEQVLVHQLHSNSEDQQSMEDLKKKMIEAEDSQLIAHALSNFIVIIADNPTYINSIDLWVWDLTICN